MEANWREALGKLHAADFEILVRQVTQEVARALASGQATESAAEPAAKGATTPADRRAALQPEEIPTEPRGLAPYIDHTLLKPDATPAQIAQLCAEAREHGFASVCTNGVFVPQTVRELAGSTVRVCAVIGFPLGAMTSNAKAAEAAELVRLGADEIDMVLQVGLLKAGEVRAVYEDIAAVRAASRGRVLKVILETALLSDAEKRAGCLLSKAAGADFVKTCTGFGGGGATAADIALMRETVGPSLGVKASGAVRTAQDGFALLVAGATRLGASAGVKIIGGGAAGAGY